MKVSVNAWIHSRHSCHPCFLPCSIRALRSSFKREWKNFCNKNFQFPSLLQNAFNHCGLSQTCSPFSFSRIVPWAHNLFQVLTTTKFSSSDPVSTMFPVHKPLSPNLGLFSTDFSYGSPITLFNLGFCPYRCSA